MTEIVPDFMLGMVRGSSGLFQLRLRHVFQRYVAHRKTSTFFRVPSSSGVQTRNAAEGKSSSSEHIAMPGTLFGSDVLSIRIRRNRNDQAERGAQETVERVMHEFKHGELKTGTGKKVRNPKQAMAIGLPEEEGASKYESEEKTQKNQMYQGARAPRPNSATRGGKQRRPKPRSGKSDRAAGSEKSKLS